MVIQGRFGPQIALESSKNDIRADRARAHSGAVSNVTSVQTGYLPRKIRWKCLHFWLRLLVAARREIFFETAKKLVF